LTAKLLATPVVRDRDVALVIDPKVSVAINRYVVACANVEVSITIVEASPTICRNVITSSNVIVASEVLLTS
jgi:predicted metallo-beta-lactamase superfamily hydrolase